MADSVTAAASAAVMLRRGVGLALIALSIAPVWRLLDDPATGLAGAATVEFMRDQSDLAWSGALLGLIPLVLFVWLGDRVPLARWLDAGARRIASVPSATFACFVFFAATAAAAAFSLLVLEAKPNLIDAMAQLAHARHLASGRIAGPAELAEFHFIANSVLTPDGWVSQYPPGHAVLLALGMLLHAEWLVGPLALGMALAVTALIADRTLPDVRVAARLFVLLACVSPFLLAHAGSYMNHTTTAAFVAVAVLFILRATAGDARWAIAAGVAASIALAIRPLSTLAMVIAVALAAWLPAHGAGFAARRIALACLGALPLTALHLWYNDHFFGSPLTLGYVAAYGPSHGLGFGLDPWGNAYGLAQAAAYTSADLTALSFALFEMPLPFVAIAGFFLLVVRGLKAGEAIVAAWAIAPVAANALYWHHGNFMGPRMLNEAAPAWVLLIALAVARMVSAAPEAMRIGSGARRPLRNAIRAAIVVVAIAALAFQVPSRLASWGGDYYRSRRIPAPSAPAPALVFVHGPWMSRIAARLSAAGMRSDTLETALRQNTTCTVEIFASAYETHAQLLPLDLEPRADRALPRTDISPDNYIRYVPGERLPGICVTQIRADRTGVLELAPLLWQGTPPGGEGGVLLARDMGPERNARLIAREPGRTPWLFAAMDVDSAPRLIPYADGMRLLWHAAPAPAQ